MYNILMEKLPKFIKNIVKIGAVASVGLFPGQLKGQDIIKNTEKEITIESSEQLNSQIFNEIEVAYKNGILRNEPESAYYLDFKKDGYSIGYKLNSDGSNKKDESPTLELGYHNGNLNYFLQKSPNEVMNRDIVYNYKDSSLSNSETKSYGDFFVENIFFIADLHDRSKDPVHFRKINENEKQIFLDYLKELTNHVDSVGISENNKNISNKDNEIKQKETRLSKNTIEVKEIGDIIQNVSDILKDKKLESKVADEAPYRYFHGNYEIIDDQGSLQIYFLDSDGSRNELYITLNNKDIKIAQKINLKNRSLGIQQLSNIEIKKIIEGALFELINK